MSSKTEEARVEVILNGQKANATLNEMRAAVRTLSAELGKIPDPLNNADYSAGKKKLDDLKEKVAEVTGKANEAGTSFQGMAKQMAGFAVPIAAIGGVAYTAFEGIKKVLDSTWGSATGLRGTIEGLKAGYDSLFVSINTGDWSHLFSNFVTANKLAKDLVDQEEKLNLMILTNSLKNSQLRAQATSLYQDIYTATSKEDKLTAIQKYLDLMHEVMDNDLKVAKQEELTANTAFDKATVHLKLTADEALAITNMNADEREYYKIYNENIDKLNKAETGLSKARGDRNETQESQFELQVNQYKKLTTAAEQTAGFHKDLAEKIREFYQIGGKIDEATGIPKVISGLMGAEKNISDIENQYNLSTRRMLKQKQTVTNEINGEDDKTQNKLIHDAEEYSKTILDIRQNLEKSLIGLIQDQRDKELQMVRLDFERKLDEIKGNSQDENDLRASLLDLANKQADEINQKYDKKKIDDSLKIEKEKWEAIIKADIDGSAKWFTDSKTLLAKMKEIELSNTKLTAEQKQAIKDKYDNLEKSLINTVEKGKWDEKIKADKTGSAQWLTDSQAWLKEQEDAELADTTLTEEQKQAIILKYAQKTQELLNQAKSGTMSSRSGADQLNDFDMASKRKLLEAQRDAELEIAKQKNDALKKLAGDNANEQEKIAKNSTKDQEGIWDDFHKSLSKERLKEIKGIIETGQKAIDALSAIFNAQNEIENQALQKDQDANDKKKADLDKRLKAGLISQKNYDAQIAGMDLEMDAKKRKLAHDQAVRQKELNIMNAIISTALAIVQALTAGPVIGEVLAVIVAALGAIQIAAIIATPVPAAAKGKYDVIGQDDGKTYSAEWGGKPKTGIYDKPTLISEEGPELIVDAETTKNIQENYPEVLKFIEKARVPGSAKTGTLAKPILISEAGPELVVDAPTIKNLKMNFPGVLDAINFSRVPQFAVGSYPNATTTNNKPLQVSVSTSNPKLEQTLERLNKNLEKEWFSKISYDHLMEEMEKVNSIKNTAKRF